MRIGATVALMSCPAGRNLPSCIKPVETSAQAQRFDVSNIREGGGEPLKLETGVGPVGHRYDDLLSEAGVRPRQALPGLCRLEHHPDEVRHRFRLHLLHDFRAMVLDRSRARAQQVPAALFEFPATSTSMTSRSRGVSDSILAAICAAGRHGEASGIPCRESRSESRRRRLISPHTSRRLPFAAACRQAHRHRPERPQCPRSP